MVYELYVDSLFLVNFVMNLYLLILVNRSTLRTATRKGMLLGAGLGAIVYLLAFLIEQPAWLKLPIMFLAGTCLMVQIAFRPKGLKAFFRILGQLFRYSFLIGGLLLFVSSAIPVLQAFMTRISGVLGVGALGFLLVGYIQEKEFFEKRNASCRVRLTNHSASVKLSALVDSGNSLTEPISGKPVSIVDARIFHALWGDEEVGYRAVPYHSIGRKRGILRAYLLPELEVEIGGIRKCFQDVYVAVSEETGSEGMILNPRLLKYTGTSKQKSERKKKKENGFKGGNAGKTAV